MPYIKQKRRDALADGDFPITSGELNYSITVDILSYINRLRELYKLKEADYQIYNEVIGVLECVKQELYRREIISYENRKCKENSDVY